MSGTGTTLRTTPHPTTGRRGGLVRVPLAVALAGCLALAACGDADDDATAATDAAATDASGPVVEVTMVDFAYEGLPDRLDPGTRVTVTNAAETEVHELVAFRLPDDETRPVEELVQLPPPDLRPILGQPVMVLLAEPGGPMITASGDGVLAEPGRYAVVCFIPTGLEPGEYLAAAAESPGGPPQFEDAGPPHVVLGMHAEVEVEVG
jgi:hypothetical protein